MEVLAEQKQLSLSGFAFIICAARRTAFVLMFCTLIKPLQTTKLKMLLNVEISANEETKSKQRLLHSILKEAYGKLN
jgi:hypothetical protein